MIYGSVCSGIESASVAWSALDWRASFLSEIEKFPRAVLAHHYPDIPLHGDFVTIEADQYDPIDLLVGGTPCQSFSISGLRGGLDDDRGNLALEYLRLAQRLRPKWLVWENVPGVLSSDEGRDFGSILGGLVECGYGFAYRVLDAQYIRVDGYARAVPQRRRRVFVVGYIGDWRRAASVLFEREGLQGNPAPRREAGQNPAPTLSARTKGGGGLGTDFDCDGGLVAGTLTNSGKAAGSATAQDAQNGETFVAAIQERAVSENPDSGPDGVGARDDGAAYTLEARTTTQAVCFDETQITSKENRSQPQAGDPSHPLSAAARPPSVAFSTKDYGNDAMTEVAPTMRAMGHDGSPANAGGQLGVLANWRVRRLTPRECERLQGFPDGYTDVPWRNKNWTPDGPRYKALGNSMAVNAMRWIGMRIQEVEDITV